MRRREFIILLSGATTTWPVAAWAQEFKRTYRIGVITNSLRIGVNYVAFFDELRSLGFVEGQNLIVDERGFAARSDQFSELAREIFYPLARRRRAQYDFFLELFFLAIMPHRRPMAVSRSPAELGGQWQQHPARASALTASR